MNTAMKIRPRAFKAGPLVTLDMRLDRGFMSGVLVQDRSLAANHGTAAGGSNLPIPQYPGFLFDQSDNQSIGASDVLTGNVYPYTFAAWVKYSGADAERCILSLGEAASVHHCTLKTYTNEYGCTGRDKDAGMPDTGSCLTSGGAIEADVWKCLTVVCPADGPDGVSVDWSVYLNGVEDSNVQTVALLILLCIVIIGRLAMELIVHQMAILGTVL